MTAKVGPCRTPGAVYETDLADDRITLSVIFPLDVIEQLSGDEKDDLILDMHDNVLPLIERLYSRVWKELFAGKVLADNPRPLPDEHDQL